jgi:hypothetical protein
VTPAEALRIRSQELVVIIGYPESGWTVSVRLEPSGPLLLVSGHDLDAACTELLGVLNGEPPAGRRKLVRKR